MLGRILNRVSFSENRRRYLNLRGIISGRYAYKGPDVAQIDVTDKCDSGCSVCWMHSPLLKEKPADFPELGYPQVVRLIDELKAAGTRELIFSGGGEPFMHPRIWQILEYAQNSGMRLRLNTGFTLLDGRSIIRLANFKKLVSVTVSAWSGRADLYSLLHNRSQEQFYRLRQGLEAFNSARRKNMEVKVYAVISSRNYFDLTAIAGLARETGCTGVEFGVVDAIPGATDRFLLNETQLDILKHGFLKLAKRMKRSRVKIINKALFLRRISSPRARHGEYDSPVWQSPCYAGWHFLRVRANGDINPCLKSHRMPVGNIHGDGFASAWNGRRQQLFRMQGVFLPRSRRYFKLIGNYEDGRGCGGLCDNILVNENMHRRLRYFFRAGKLRQKR